MTPFDFNPDSPRPLLHLSPANGFPAATYRKILEPLLASHHAVSLPMRPLWGDTPPRWLKHWDQMAEDLAGGLAELGAKGIIGVGHSLGGVLTLAAAVRHPELFSRVILLDPTLLAPGFLWKIRLLRCVGFEARSFLVKGALKRKRNWGSAEEAYVYFRSRRLFADWTDEIVRTYVENNTAPSRDGGVALVYPPEWEARIYQTLPTDVWKSAAKLRQPTLVIRGERSNTFTAQAEKAFRKAAPQAVFRLVPGAGHLLAQEKPGIVGSFMREFLQDKG